MENNTKPFYNTEIPSDWKVKALCEIAKNRNSSLSINSLDNNFGDYLLYGASGIIKSIFFFEEEEEYISIVKDGAGVGRVFLCEKNSSVLGTMAYIKPLNKNCNLEYLYFLFQSIDYSKYITGSTIPHIYFSSYSAKKILLPPLPEQKAIARVLKFWDNAIQKNEQLIAQKQQRKKWLMQNLLTGKKRLNGFEGEWNLVQISELFTPVDRYVEWNENELYNLISIRRRNGGVFFREPLFGYQIGVKKLKTVANNDFVVSKRQASHGAWAVIDQVYDQTKVSGEYDTLEISNQSLLSVDFWKWYCQIPILTHYANVDSDGVHIEKSIFDYNLFKRRKVFIPSSIKEQTAIAQILQSVDTEISLLKAKAEKLREQKKGLMQQLLTGKVRLNVNE